MSQENQNIEHRRIWKDEYMKWVSGFANAYGGKIYFGIIMRGTFLSVRGGLPKGGANGAKIGANADANLTEDRKIINLIKSIPTISLDDIAKKLSVGRRTIDREIKRLIWAEKRNVQC